MKKTINRLLARAGWELKRIRNDPQTGQVYRNPFDARFDGSQLIQVAMSSCTDKIGFCYGGWHPWVETVKQLNSHESNVDYRSSVLQRFYQTWSFPLLNEVFSQLSVDAKTRNHFLKVFHGNFLPFSGRHDEAIGKRIQVATSYLASENQRAGFQLGVEESLNQDGTWSEQKGEIELTRLRKLLESISQRGYLRSPGTDGDILAYPLFRNGVFRFVVVSGLHRMSVLAALGFDEITIKMYGNMVIEPSSVDSWPLVRQGIYSRQKALEYFDHLFDFDSTKWATQFMTDTGNPG